MSYYAKIALGLALIWLSALAVVFLKFENRRLFSELQSLQTQMDVLHREWTQLLLEQSTWVQNQRVERLAKEKLNMRMPKPDEIQVIWDDGTGQITRWPRP